MLEVFSWFVIFLLNYFLGCYAFCKINKKKFYINKKFLILTFIFSVFNCYINMNFDLLMKSLTTNFFSYLLFKIMYKENTTSTMISELFIYIGFVVSEIIFSMLFIFINNMELEQFISSVSGYLLSNIIIFSIFILLFNIKKTYIFIRIIILWCEKYKWFNTLFKIVLTEILCFMFMYPISFKRNFNSVIVFFLSLIGIIVFVVGYFKEKSSNNKLNIKYDNLLEYSKIYEEEVIEKSKKQHEYKNQLILIDSMISKTNKKAKEYIKNIIRDEELELENGWLVKLNNLPSGGIKGLICFKIKKMIRNNISIYIEVDKFLSKKKSWINVEKYLSDISKIIGVYLDNAIEAAIDSKDKQIIIEFINKKDNIIFKLSNSHNEKINYENIDNEGITTKGKGRGYGLSLVKDIIETNDILSQETEVDGKFFVQKLYIKK